MILILKIKIAPISSHELLPNEILALSFLMVVNPLFSSLGFSCNTQYNIAINFNIFIHFYSGTSISYI